VSPPNAYVSPIGRKFQGGGSPPVAKSRGSNSNALAYAEHPISNMRNYNFFVSGPKFTEFFTVQRG